MKQSSVEHWEKTSRIFYNESKTEIKAFKYRGWRDEVKYLSTSNESFSVINNLLIYQKTVYNDLKISFGKINKIINNYKLVAMQPRISCLRNPQV